MTVAIATPVLLLWLPVVGCLVGVAAAVLFVVVGEPPPVTWSFGLVGAGCAVVAIRLGRARRDARRMARSLTRVVAAVLAVLLGVGLLGWARHLEGVESRHLQRSVAGSAEVVTSAYGEITVEVEGPVHGGGRADLPAWSDEGYPVGASVPVLLDPTDAGWVRLLAEPFDPSGWQAAGLGALLFGIVVGARELRRRWVLQTLWLGAHPALEVLVVPDLDDDVLVFPRDADPAASEPVAWVGVAALLPASPAGLEELDDGFGDDPEDGDLPSGRSPGERTLDPELREALAEEWRGKASVAGWVEPLPAVLLGDPSPGGWALVVLEDRVLVPSTPLRPLAEAVPLTERWRRWWRVRVDRLPLTVALPVAAAGPAWRQDGVWPPGIPVEAAAADGDGLGGRPIEASPPPRVRVLGLVAVAASLGGPAAALVLADGWFRRLVFLFAGGHLLGAGVWRVATRLRAGDAGFEVGNGWTRHQVPWEVVYGLRRDGDRLLAAWEPDVVIELPSLATGTRGGEEAAAAAARLGAALERRRERAAGSGLGAAVEFRRAGLGWWLLAGYLAAGVATLVALATGTVTGPGW
jgi:hypothetical protein